MDEKKQEHELPPKGDAATWDNKDSQLPEDAPTSGFRTPFPREAWKPGDIVAADLPHYFLSESATLRGSREVVQTIAKILAAGKNSEVPPELLVDTLTASIKMMAEFLDGRHMDLWKAIEQEYGIEGDPALTLTVRIKRGGVPGETEVAVIYNGPSKEAARKADEAKQNNADDADTERSV